LYDAGLDGTTSVLGEIGSKFCGVSLFLANFARFVIALEPDTIRWRLSQAHLGNDDHINNVILLNVDGTSLASFAPCTHVFSFNVMMPPAIVRQLLEAMANTLTLKSAILFTPPTSFNLPNWSLVKTYQKLRVKGGKELLTAYLYKKDGVVLHRVPERVPSATALAEVAEPAFQAGFQAVADGTLKDSIKVGLQEFLGAPRKRRRSTSIA